MRGVSVKVVAPTKEVEFCLGTTLFYIDNVTLWAFFMRAEFCLLVGTNLTRKRREQASLRGLAILWKA